MYKIDSFTLKQYVEDEWIKIPRFQRAKTWKAKQKFELAVSIFKKYPLGCVILCSQSDQKTGESTRWLIDGRQRYTTIKDILKSPTLIYEWAKTYLNIKNGMSQPEIEDKFWKKVEEFTNYDPNDRSDDYSSDISNESDDFDDEIENESSNEDSQKKDSNLSKLLDLITFCHTYKKDKNCGLTQVFDIGKYVEKDRKYTNKFLSDKPNELSCLKIKNLIYSYKEYCNAEEKKYEDKNNYIDFLDIEFKFNNENSKNKYVEERLNSWENQQLKAIKIFENIDNILNNAFIAVISVQDANSTDEQKIFNLINSNGTPLTAAEVLSAKPSWNKPVDHLSNEIKQAIKILYKDRLENTDIDTDYCVRWDLPACLTSLLKNFDIFFPVTEYENDKDKSSKATTLGFKLYSGIIIDGIKKEDLESLSTSPKLNGDDFEDFIHTFNSMLASISEINYFKVLKSWKLSLSKIIGDGPTISFLLHAYHMYEIENKPRSGSVAFEVFKKNCFIILDTLVYEYVNSVWRGSGDSLVAQRIKSFKATYHSGNNLEPITEKIWDNLLDEIIEKNQINGRNILFSMIKPIIMHYFCIKNKKCSIDYEFSPDFDHIIPQSSFTASNLENKDLLKDNLYNISLLPKSKNAAKNDRSLKSLEDETIISAVVEYEEINEEDFDKYSKPTDIFELKKYRGALIKKSLLSTRTKILNN